jgi:hypothetical protein
MFKCGICNGLSVPGEKAFPVVVEVREASYPYKEAAHRFRKESKTVIKDDPGGTGIEVAREVLAHRTCVNTNSPVVS